MKPKFSFLYLLLLFAVTTALLYFGLPFFLQEDTTGGFAGVAEGFAYIILWGLIFCYYLMRKCLIWVFNRRNNLTDVKIVKRKATWLSLVLTVILGVSVVVVVVARLRLV